MNVRQLLELLLSYALDGRGVTEPVFMESHGQLRTIETVEIRLIPDGDDRPKATYVLIVADGPAPSSFTNAN